MKRSLFLVSLLLILVGCAGSKIKNDLTTCNKQLAIESTRASNLAKKVDAQKYQKLVLIQEVKTLRSEVSDLKERIDKYLSYHCLCQHKDILYK
jgi:hypothetical protein